MKASLLSVSLALLSSVSIAQNEGGSLKTYANYDFVPGDKILFEDHFTDDQDGEFPSHWQLENGQAVLNKVAGFEAVCLTDGNLCRINPRIKGGNYLGSSFTVEFDVYNPGGAYGPELILKNGSDDLVTVEVNTGEVAITYDQDKTNSASLPADLREDAFLNKWHHIAVAYKDKQLKVYVDQYRLMVMPDCGAVPTQLDLGGIGVQASPIIIANMRVASGGGMYMLDKKFMDAKIVTHGINFDVDKSNIKPESMGTLNSIVRLMKANPDLHFEIGGHTDNSGSGVHNLSLSQTRAEAVKAQLVSMGIDASRLTTKGYGDSKPISDNNTLEGKANNRRVEFVRIGA